MFSGIVAARARIISFNEKLTCQWVQPLKDIELGESLSLNGVCLTVTESSESSFSVDVSSETMEVTTAKYWKEGTYLNIERALRYSDLVGGHLVSGHVDAVAHIKKVATQEEYIRMDVELPSGLTKYIIPKGSIAIDGVSLTVNDIKDNTISLMLVPFTLENTNLKELKTKDPVNIELDLVGKYVYKYTQK